MQLVQMIVPAEAAHGTVTALGEVGLVQFRDLNPDRSAFQRTYASQVKRCDEMLRKMRFFAEQMHKAGLVAVPRADAEDRAYHLDELEARLEELEPRTCGQITANTEKLRKSHSELVELQLVLRRLAGFRRLRVWTPRGASARGTRGASFGRWRPLRDRHHHLRRHGFARRHGRDAEMGESLLGANASGAHSRSASREVFSEYEMPQSALDPSAVRLGFIAATVPTHKTASFERVLFRATRGNMFLKQSVIEGKVICPRDGERAEKTVCVVFFAGERARFKILKICEAFGANRYPFPENVARRRQMNSEVTARTLELQSTLEASERHRNGVLSGIGHKYERWLADVRKEKATYHALNAFSVDVTRKCLVAEGGAQRRRAPRAGRRFSRRTAQPPRRWARCSSRFPRASSPDVLRHEQSDGGVPGHRRGVRRGAVPR